jgi:hypothetical protein
LSSFHAILRAFFTFVTFKLLGKLNFMSFKIPAPWAIPAATVLSVRQSITRFSASVQRAPAATPLLACRKNNLRCGAGPVPCPAGTNCAGGFCLAACKSSTDCDCGETCTSDGHCASKCLSSRDCQNGVQCVAGACVPGCRADGDCSLTETCIQGQCANPCANAECGSNAKCEVSQHQAVCLCLSGYERDAVRGCRKAECSKDTVSWQWHTYSVAQS